MICMYVDVRPLKSISSDLDHEENSYIQTNKTNKTKQTKQTKQNKTNKQTHKQNTPNKQNKTNLQTNKQNILIFKIKSL